MGMFARLFAWLDNLARKWFSGASAPASQVPAPAPQVPVPLPVPPAPPSPVIMPVPPRVAPKGAWIWQEDKLPKDNIAHLAAQGCKRVYLKILDDANPGVLWPQAGNIPKYVAAGIEVWGWGYHCNGVPNNAATAQAINVAMALGMTGYVFDLEGELESNASKTSQALILIRYVQGNVNGNLTLGYSSFGAPDLHPAFPYAALQQICDVQLPQIYYELWAGDAKANVNACIRAHANMGLNKKPIYPVFSSEAGATHPTTLETLQSLLDTYTAASVWRLPHVGEAGLGYEVKYSPKPTLPIKPSHQDIPERLMAYYGKKVNYDAVYKEVMGWYGTTSNGCAAFMSTALRDIGIQVPHGVGRAGDDISLVTLDLADWMLDQGWTKVTDTAALVPGDVCFSQDDPAYPGYPAHVYMLATKIEAGFAQVVDNQGFMYSRNITSSGPKTPFHYALRAL